jgi:hypothetical protein
MGNCCSHDATATIPHDAVVTAGPKPSNGTVGPVATTTTADAMPPEGPTPEKLSPEGIPSPQPHDDPGLQANASATNGAGGPDGIMGTPNYGSVGTPMSSTSSMSPLARIHTPRKRTTRGESMDLEVPAEMHSVRIGNYNLRYSYYSKRGYYPEGTLNVTV